MGYCPSLVLADALMVGRGSSPVGVGGKTTSRLYVYSTSQAPGASRGFCPLMPFQTIPEYCPHYAFHAADLFALFAPDWNRIVKRFGGPAYSRTDADDGYGQLLLERFTTLAAEGSVDAWSEYSGDGH